MALFPALTLIFYRFNCPPYILLTETPTCGYNVTLQGTTYPETWLPRQSPPSTAHTTSPRE